MNDANIDVAWDLMRETDCGIGLVYVVIVEKEFAFYNYLNGSDVQFHTG